MTDPDETGPGPMEWWDLLLEDMAASAAEYEDRGWETLELHTADVTPLDGEFGEDVGLSVLVPDNEFDALADALDEGGIDGFEAYRTTAMGYVALLVVLEDRDRERAVLFPAYYSTGDDAADRLFEQATAEGELAVFVRTLAEQRVEVTLSEPELLAPPDTDGDEADSSPDTDDEDRSV